MVYDRARQSIEQGNSVIIDGTHTNAEMRRRDINQYRQYGARAVIGIYVQTDTESCIERNTQRDRVVPEFVIRNMQIGIDRYPPSTQDGFDYIIPVVN